MYFQGKSQTARRTLVRVVRDPQVRDPGVRLSAIGALLDICIHSQSRACILEYVPKYIEAAEAAPTANEIQRRELARTLGYYVDYGRYVFGAPEITGKILAGSAWKQENPFNPDLYIRRQMLASSILVSLDEHREAGRSIDRVVSLIASLKNPQEDRFLIAWALCDVIDTLVEMGEVERAYGIYRATGTVIAKSLPPLSVDAVAFRLVEARLLQERGDLKGSGLAADAAITTIGRIELDDDVRERLLADALIWQAVACAGQLQLDCAREATDRHPFAGRYARPGRQPASDRETTYLAVRALIRAFEASSDPVAAEALRLPAAHTTVAGPASMVEVYRLAGVALALPPGRARQDGLFEAGRRIAEVASRRPSGAFGAWYRPGTLDQVLIGLALTQAGRDEPDADEVAFALFQLAGRQGASFDTDALTALGQARDELQRRSIHQALRLRARRDRVERVELQSVAERSTSAAPTGTRLSYDFDRRRVFRDFAFRMDQADSGLAEEGVSTSGANLISLARFQSTLGPDEAALALAPAPGGVAYMCIRRDSTRRSVGAADLRRAQLDIRIVQSALSAGHAPSESLDAQFPAEAAVRLYDVLIRPFEGCLRPGDHILWLPNASITPLPLSALLERTPPKLGRGYDLAAADWLVRRYAISYAGSASAVAAARTVGRTSTADFDFLGVGDPVLTGATEVGADRSQILLRGVRSGSGLAMLAPLPETKDELEQSARGFRTTKLLTQGEATERGVRSQLIGSYRFLSFATHGLLRDDLQGLSEPALALTPVSADDPTNDGLLTASEIADLNLSALFVALSACNTANFDLSQMSADLPALASAFAVAGVPSTLGTLWAVESETGKRVVAATFANLRAASGRSPARALADAQRAFLAAPPGRAYLHPRFWAPFIVLGDGGDPPTPVRQDAGGMRIASVDILTRGGGEVLGVGRSHDRVLARFIAEPDAKGRRGSAVTALERNSLQAWRRDNPQIGATRFVAELGRRVVAGGYGQDLQGRFVPTLEAFDRGTGEAVRTWRGEPPPGLDAILVSGVKVGDRQAAVVVADLNLTGETTTRGGKLHVLNLDDSIAPQLLFELEPPSGSVIDEATIAPLGDALLITYTHRFPPPDIPSRLAEDDFESPLCTSVPVTWIELRDAKTGALRGQRTFRGWTVAASLSRDGRVLLGGAFKESCLVEARAAVLALDASLSAETLFKDTNLGASEARSLALLPDGGTLVGAWKESVLDYRQRAVEGSAIRSYDATDLAAWESGMLVTLTRDGRPSALKMLDSGGDLFVSAADASEPGAILVGGSLGEEAAIFHLAGRPAAAAR